MKTEIEWVMILIGAFLLGFAVRMFLGKWLDR